ncbi:hypothetical protein ANCDUO_16468, partial [Ancylostoma duodenale]
SLGRRHVVMQGRGFDPLYWETFAECMTQAAVEWEANRQRPTLGAWRTLVSNLLLLLFSFCLHHHAIIVLFLMHASL